MVLAPEWLGLAGSADEYARNSAASRPLARCSELQSTVWHTFRSTLLQSAGRADLTAKLHLVEFPSISHCCYGWSATLGITGDASRMVAALHSRRRDAVLAGEGALASNPSLLSVRQLSAVGSLLGSLALSAVPLWSLDTLAAIVRGRAFVCAARLVHTAFTILSAMCCDCGSRRKL